MLGHCLNFRQTPFGHKREGPNHRSNGSCLDCYISRYWNNSLYSVWWSLFFCKSLLEHTCDSCKLCWCCTLFLDKIKWFWCQRLCFLFVFDSYLSLFIQAVILINIKPYFDKKVMKIIPCFGHHWNINAKKCFLRKMWK